MTMPADKLPDIRKIRKLDDPIWNVWEAIATADGIARWFVPNDFQPVLGRGFQAEMEEPQGKTACKVTTIDAPARLAYDVGNDWSWIFDLKEIDGGTELTFTWTGWDANKSTEFGMSHTTLHPQLVNGTDVLIKRLARSVRNHPSTGTSQSSGEIVGKETTLPITGMSCGHCIEKIEKALKELGVKGQVRLGSVTIFDDAHQVSLEAVKEAIEDLGYDIT
jgi:copper chaperone CopZ/uncharacterized protein YndB with AHSA1/START domain